MSQKDIYIYYMIFVQVLCMSLLVWMPVYSDSSDYIEKLFADEEVPAKNATATAAKTLLK